MRKKQEVWMNVVLPYTFCALKFLTLSNYNWTLSFDQIKFISGASFNFHFFFGGIFYQNVFNKCFSLCLYKIFDKNQ